MTSSVAQPQGPTYPQQRHVLVAFSGLVLVMLLAQTVVTPIYGKMGDLYGRTDMRGVPVGLLACSAFQICANGVSQRRHDLRRFF